MNTNPILGQTIVDFAGEPWIFLAKVDKGVIVKCPITLKDYVFAPFIFGMSSGF